LLLIQVCDKCDLKMLLSTPVLDRVAQ